jgi:hypothetical protein
MFRQALPRAAAARQRMVMLVLVALLAGSAGSVTTSAAAAPRPAVPSRTYFGAYVNGDAAAGQTRTDVQTLEGKIGRTLDIGHHYRRWTDTGFPNSPTGATDEAWDVANGRIPMISQDDKGFSGGNIVAAINNGSQDALIRSRASRIRAFGRPLFYRLFWEMNGDWASYNEAHTSTPGTHDGPQKFIAAWRRIHDIFQRQGATNAAFVWCPNANDKPRTPENHWSRYYPGDAYVDWVCADGYNWGTGRSWSVWQSFQSIFAGIYAGYPQKPFMVAETSSVEVGGDKGQWIRDTQTTIKARMPRIKAIVWFSRGPGPQSPEDWRFDSSTRALAAYRAMGADPYFNP